MASEERQMMVGKHPMSPFGNTEAVNDEEYWEDRAKRLQAALAESEARAEAVRQRLIEVTSTPPFDAQRAMEQACIALDVAMRAYRAMGMAADSIYEGMRSARASLLASLGGSPPPSGPLTNRDREDGATE